MSAQYTDEGLRVLLAEDYFIYVVREHDGLVFVYKVEIWPEWRIVGMNAPLSALIPFANKHTPYPVAKSECNYCDARGLADQMTLDEWALAVAA